MSYDFTRWAQGELDLLASQHLTRTLEPLQSAQGPTVRVGGQSLINFSSNDYLGLAASPLLIHAAQQALDAHGLGSGASRLVAGDSALHHALEASVARFLGSEAALLFNSGYAANVGLVSALWGKTDILFSDAHNHASLIDGCRLSRARTLVYPHNDVAALEALLSAHPQGRRAVLTDAVFSMNGDTARLHELSALCERHGAALVVDEAHATGVFGPTGAGLCEAQGVSADLRMGTLGKSLGGFGAYVACDAAVRSLLIHRARSLVFSTALPAAWCAAGVTAIARVQQDTALRERLWSNIKIFTTGLRELGFEAVAHSPIFSVVLGAPERAMAASAFLRERGVWAKPIRPPTVPPGTSRLRMTLRADHSPAHLQQALTALADWQKAERR
ncbi:MAG: 8-amino-7-oxononanoate synthase [Myxococcaceae bacterium]|nr:8-amino-7-oxononanoate synthase [Myxococcaceae bacterium]